MDVVGSLEHDAVGSVQGSRHRIQVFGLDIKEDPIAEVVRTLELLGSFFFLAVQKNIQMC